MAELFDRIKAEVNIVSWVESDIGARAKREGATLRISPCPFCGHANCFTLFPHNNTFHCFSASCEINGTLIDYVIRRQNLSTPLEAAKIIAEKMGIREDEAWTPGSREAGRQEHKNPGTPYSVISPQRAAEARRMAAEWYHGEFLNNPEARAYQLEQRRHSMQTLVAFQVGYASGGSLLKHAVAEGFTAEELMGVGLVKKGSSGYRPTIPGGAYVYPHFVDGQYSYFTIKRGKEEKPFQVKKEFAAYGWLCYNQDAFTSPKVVIVEGENDLLSVVDKACFSDVVAAIGNYNTSNILTFLEQNSADKDYFLCFDNDEAGGKYNEKYSAAIRKGGGSVRVVHLPEGVKDIDDYLRSVPDPEAAFRDLLASAEEPPSAPEASDDGVGEPPAGGDLFTFKNFTTLGEMEDGRVVCQANDIQKIHIVSLRDLTMEKLCQIGGIEVKQRVARNKDEMMEGQVHLYALRKHMVLEARKHQLGPIRWVGQGILLLDDGRFLVVNGSEAYTYAGATLEKYDEAMIEHKIISRRSASRWIDSDALAKEIKAMDRDRARKAVLDLWEIVCQWGFEGKFDTDLVTGFVLSQMVQSIWAWRPHLWITGPQGCGKTILLDICKELGGDLAKHFEGSSTSEAGLRQGIRNDFVLAAIDEFERTEEREKILSYLRTAGRGGFIVKGSPGQEVTEYYLRHMVMVASIETGLVKAAEKTRFITVELKKDPNCNPKMPTVADIEDLRIRLFAMTLWSAGKCLDLIRRMERIPGQDPRLVEAYAVPLSMMAIPQDDPPKHLRMYLDLILAEHQGRQDQTPEDEESILEAILSSTVRVAVEDGADTVYTDRTILWLLNSRSVLHREDAAANGVWLLGDGSIFLATDIIRRRLLKDTPWKSFNITSILRRHPGIENHRAKRKGKLYHGLKYSGHDLVQDMQIGFADEE